MKAALTVIVFVINFVLPVLPDEPLRLPNGEPLVCAYYFGHWWEPWKSNDEAIRQDFKRLRAMGFNTVLLDHEWSQAIDGDGRLLDREHRFARESGLFIVPWLSASTWHDVDTDQRAEVFKQWFGVSVQFGENQDGSRASPVIYDAAILEGGSKYAEMYLRRFLNQAILRLVWNGAVRPVISLSVESGWIGSFDQTTNLWFKEWLRTKYKSVAALNQAWQTRFLDFLEVDPRDKSIFDYSGHIAGKAQHPQAVEDHVEFRAEPISDVLAEMGATIRKKYPSVLLLAEIPYQYGSQNPDAIQYRMTYAGNPRSCDYADVVLFRNTGPLNGAEIDAMRARQKMTGQRCVFTTRTYSDWDVLPSATVYEPTVRVYSEQAQLFASGLGFYTWNEMVETHVAYSPGADINSTWTKDRSEKAIGLMATIVTRYYDQVGIRPTLGWEAPSAVDGLLRARIYGNKNASLVVQTSPDLLNWKAAGSYRINDAGFLDFSVLTGTGSSFYRGRLQP